MLHVPWMNQEIVQQQRYDCYKKRMMQHRWVNHIIYRMIYIKMRSRRKMMEHVSETDSQAQSQLPSQEERVHARAALAMFGKLDIEEQETASNDSQAKT